MEGRKYAVKLWDPQHHKTHKAVNNPAPTSPGGIISSYANPARPTTTGGWNSTGRKAPMPGVLVCFTCKGVGHPTSECPNKKVKKGTSVFAKNGCFNCGKVGHYADRCPSPKKFCSQCNVLGHVVSECWVANAIRRQAEREKNKKREGEALAHLRTKQPVMREGFTNAITNGPFAKNRLEETSGSTVASESRKNGITMPMASPPLSSAGPAGARPQ